MLHFILFSILQDFANDYAYFEISHPFESPALLKFIWLTWFQIDFEEFLRPGFLSTW
jgi:hypothetical protein